MTDVLPAVGVKPADAAKELRVAIKDMYQRAAASGTAAQSSASGTAEKHLVNAAAQRMAANNLWKEVNQTLRDLCVIAKNRRPSETQAAVDNALVGVFARYTQALARERVQMEYAIRHLKQGPPYHLPTLAEVERWYSLVQVLPTIDNPPVGEAENALRAITAIVKAYHGLLMEKPDAIPSPEIPIVLVTVANEKKKPAAKPEAAPTLAFKIGNVKNPGGYLADIVQDKGYAAHGSDVDGPGDASGWNKGNCSLEDAMQTFRRFCQRYSGEYWLATVSGDRCGFREKTGGPIVWSGDALKLAKKEVKVGAQA